jgi:vancomycin permeability regulator SanA
VGWALVAVAVLALTPAVWVQAVGQTRVVADPAEVRPRGVALVLGAGLAPDGSPSPYLRRRLDAAVDLYAAGQVTTILASGDGVLASHDEPGAMRDWLLARGVPDSAIVLDREGVDTTTSCIRAREVFGVDRAVVVTQDYHLRRALFSCRSAGIDVLGIGVSAQSAKPVQALWWHVREAPASVKAAWDALAG